MKRRLGPRADGTGGRSTCSSDGEGRLTPETVRRQERLFHRLLDAGRSLEREEFSEERESEQPGVFERGEVMPLTPDQLGALRYNSRTRTNFSA
ncbi:MAG: hypothetical protein Ct9H300mP15_08570 [Gemmatimonadota bacterium]|nr:MAG: hypothetical protein Ct9H300mP15_08570 [Gemmatimonadota bacterium]